MRRVDQPVAGTAISLQTVGHSSCQREVLVHILVVHIVDITIVSCVVVIHEYHMHCVDAGDVSFRQLGVVLSYACPTLTVQSQRSACGHLSSSTTATVAVHSDALQLARVVVIHRCQPAVPAGDRATLLGVDTVGWSCRGV